MGCSSPRLVVGVGDGVDGLFDALRDEIRARAYGLELGAVLAKRTAVYGALAERPVARLRELGNELTVLELTTLEGFDRTHPGAGLFYAIAMTSLDDLAPYVVRKDQTMTVSGIDGERLARFVRQVNGRGIDRIVPFGEALTFGRYWDGYDLLAELTRRVYAGTTLATSHSLDGASRVVG
jgi:hypothetical protein